MQFFKPATNYLATWLFWLAGILLLSGGTIFYFQKGFQKETEILWAAGGIWMLILWLNQTPLLVKYGISQDGIYLKRWWLKRFIPKEEIKSVCITSANEAQTTVTEMENKKDNGLYSGNVNQILGAFDGWKKQAQLTNYLSIRIVYSQFQVPFRKRGKVKARVSNNLVLITTTHNEASMISPKDDEGFVQTASKNFKLEHDTSL